MARTFSRPSGGIDVGGLLESLRGDFGAVVEEYDVEGPHCIALSLRLPAERRSVLVALRSVRVRRNLALLSASKAHSMHARAHARAVRSLMSSMEEARRRRSARAV